MSKNILITGGLGHIGSKLIKELPLEYNLTVVDNLLTQRFCSLFNVGRPIKFMDKCISDLTVNDLESIDIVIHLAAITDAANSFNNVKQTENINLTLTSSFIDLCGEAKCKFIFPSSTSGRVIFVMGGVMQLLGTDMSLNYLNSTDVAAVLLYIFTNYHFVLLISFKR